MCPSAPARCPPSPKTLQRAQGVGGSVGGANAPQPLRPAWGLGRPRRADTGCPLAPDIRAMPQWKGNPQVPVTAHLLPCPPSLTPPHAPGAPPSLKPRNLSSSSRKPVTRRRTVNGGISVTCGAPHRGTSGGLTATCAPHAPTCSLPPDGGTRKEGGESPMGVLPKK